MELIKCDFCKTDFRPTSEQLKFILSSKEKRMTLIILECVNCRISFSYNPTSPVLLRQKYDETPLRTPLSGSHGYISRVYSENDKFYGCGESGAIWRHEENLFRDIDLIINNYPHRRLCYLRNNSGWISNPEEPNNMDELIDNEDSVEFTDLERD